MLVVGWSEDILVGTFLIARGCSKNTSWNNCHDCPLEELCEIIWDKSIALSDEGETVGEYMRDVWRELLKNG